MSLIIIGKMGFAAAGIAVASLGGFLFYQWFMSSNVEIYGFVETSNATVAGSATKCKVDSETEFECIIKEVAKLTDDSKNHVSLTATTVIKETETVSASLAANKFYKITIAQNDFDYHAKEWKTKPIKVFADTTSLGSITTMFSIKHDQTLTLSSAKTKSFIGQSSEQLNTTTNYKCSWEQSPSDDQLKVCQMFSFTENDDAGQDISALTFKKSSAEVKSIKKDHYYLIQFTDDSEAKSIDSFDTTKNLIYSKASSETGSTVITFTKLSATADELVGDQLLILK